MSRKPLNLANYRFHRWTAIRHTRKGPQGFYWLCRCDCGTEREIPAKSIKAGDTKSCGCWSREVLFKRNLRHGQRRTRAYNAWMNIKKRCHNTRDPSYQRYGGRGINVCAEWYNSFTSFFAHMGECPPGMSIERIDNNGNYEPGNCRWATDYEQRRNQRRSNLITIDGETKCLKDWATQYGIDHRTISVRLKFGWTPKQAITLPVRSNRPSV